LELIETNFISDELEIDVPWNVKRDWGMLIFRMKPF
jgi:hypothetical protein